MTDTELLDLIDRERWTLEVAKPYTMPPTWLVDGCRFQATGATVREAIEAAAKHLLEV